MIDITVECAYLVVQQDGNTLLPQMALSLGQTVVTAAVDHFLRTNNVVPQIALLPFIQRHRDGDWGTLCAEDRATNEYAVKHGERVMSVYKNELIDKTIWIITEWNRSVTTVLFPSDY